MNAWLWELWNEPDIFYWRGTLEQFNALYAVTARAVRSVIPRAKVGGPTVTSGGLEFLQGFLDYTSSRNEPLDFISYHTKGCQFPTRDYRPSSSPPAEQLSPSSTKMLYDVREFNRAIAEYEQYRDLPAIVDEFDAAVPAHFGRYDNRNYDFQNTEYYPVFQVKVMKKILDLNASEIVQVERATSWSFYFEGERFFEGTRSFITAGGIEKPLLNAYRMLSLLGNQRIRATSDVAWNISALEGTDGTRHTPRRSTCWPPVPTTAKLPSWCGDTPTTNTKPANRKRRPTSRFVTCRVGPSECATSGSTQTTATPTPDGECSARHRIRLPEELAQIKARQGLEEFEPARTVDAEAGRLSIDICPATAGSVAAGPGADEHTMMTDGRKCWRD